MFSSVDSVQALVAAVKSDDVAEVRQLLDDYPALKGQLNDALPGLPFEGTVLLAAVSNENREMIEVLLDAGADINQKSHWWAGGFGVLDLSTELVPFLRGRGAVFDAHTAARLGMLDELRALVEKDPTVVHAQGGDGHTPLHVASTVAIAEYLLAQGADIDALDIDHESTAAQYLVRDHQDIVRMLVGRGCRSDILMAAALGDLALVRRHLEADPEAIRMTVSERSFPRKNPQSGGTIYIWTLGSNKSPHSVAREFGHEEVFQLLLDRTPPELRLALACELGDEPRVKELLAERPDLVQSLSEQERRKLPDAAREKNQDAVRLMLAAGWPLDTRGDLSATALHWAAWHGNLGMIKEILRYHPDVNVKGDDHDASPLAWLVHGSVNSWSCRSGDYRGAALALLEAGAEVPQLPPDFGMSDVVREVLQRHATSGRSH